MGRVGDETSERAFVLLLVKLNFMSFWYFYFCFCLHKSYVRNDDVGEHVMQYTQTPV